MKHGILSAESVFPAAELAQPLFCKDVESFMRNKNDTGCRGLRHIQAPTVGKSRKIPERDFSRFQLFFLSFEMADFLQDFFLEILGKT